MGGFPFIPYVVSHELLIVCLRSIDSASLTLANANIDGAEDFLQNIVLAEMDIRWESYEDLPRYLATRIDPKTGPVKLSATAKKSRTIVSLIEQASFIRTGKTGIMQICVCFEKLVYEEPPTRLSPSPLPNRTKIKEESNFKTAKGKERDKKEFVSSLQQVRYPQTKKNVPYGARKRGISQISSPQTEKTPPGRTPQPDENTLYEGMLSDLELPEEEEEAPCNEVSSENSPPYNLRKGKKK